MSGSSSAESHPATAKTILSAAVTVATATIVARSVAQDYMPDEVIDYISHGFRRFFAYFSSQITMVIEEFQGSNTTKSSSHLDRFVQRRDFYRKVGKAWKRGYLLYGPPGTGKSSLIAAMANHLKFDIYDLDLTAVTCNSELRKLLMATANHSILVVEDIDCTIKLKDRTDEDDGNADTQQKKVTLSGLLNFVDGLWSSCGDERIIAFTTNYKEKLDPALLRPGRMDMHIHMSYCTPSAFKVLASNYLDIKHHRLIGEIEEAIRGTEVTPADVAEQLMRDDSVDKVLEGLLEFLKAKKTENDEAKAKNKE